LANHRGPKRHVFVPFFVSLSPPIPSWWSSRCNATRYRRVTLRSLRTKTPTTRLLPELHVWRRDCLGIYIQCRSQSRMPQQFLHDFEFRATLLSSVEYV